MVDLVKSAHLGIRIDPVLKKQLEALAKAEKRTVSQYVEIVLTAHVAAKPRS